MLFNKIDDFAEKLYYRSLNPYWMLLPLLFAAFILDEAADLALYHYNENRMDIKGNGFQINEHYFSEDENQNIIWVGIYDYVEKKDSLVHAIHKRLIPMVGKNQTFYIDIYMKDTILKIKGYYYWKDSIFEKALPFFDNPEDKRKYDSMRWEQMKRERQNYSTGGGWG